jgi:hypothetical protein
MPTRLIREGILDSCEINRLTEPGEILYRRLMSTVDDYGRWEADPVLIRARCFARQLDRWSLARVREALADICQGGELVLLYQVDGKNYLQINKFRQRVRSDSKFPPPLDGHCPSPAGLPARANASDFVCASSPPASHSPSAPNAETEIPPPAPDSAPESPATTPVNGSPVPAIAVAPAPVPEPESAPPAKPDPWDAFVKDYPLKLDLHSAEQRYRDLVGPEDEAKAFACMGRYLASDQVDRGVVMGLERFIERQAADGWRGEWPRPRSPNRKPTRGEADAAAIAEIKRKMREKDERVGAG